ncbi:MAG TPA: signal peptide peptidase SppA, partial [Anaeromyxobacteraceae bacterium]|nr:signal peptide peptidase SppA [Anaeromyxobacteraceae bacterium]
MNPSDPNEPLPTTPVAGSTPPAPREDWRWGAQQPPAPPGGYGPPPSGGLPPPPPPPPKRDRLALGVVLFVFGGLFLVFFGFLLLAYSVVRGESPRIASGPRVGVVEVKGAIGSDAGGADAEDVLKQLKRYRDDGGMKAVVVRIDSPGGAVGPSQEIYDEVKKLAADRVVICSMGSMAASGGFYVAMGCDRIVAEPGTITGSIGVISQFANISGLVERFDVKMETIKSGQLKDAGNPFRDMTPEDRAYWQGLIDRVHAQFIRAVVAGRKLPEDQVRKVADGRVITGEEAKDLGLIDQLGN